MDQLRMQPTAMGEHQGIGACRNDAPGGFMPGRPS
jgi:hypothetical protein